MSELAGYDAWLEKPYQEAAEEQEKAMTCSECDAELELDEPQTCYFTGRGPCGDCRDPRTGKPPYPGGCFGPILCEDCRAKS